jgi:hypothetical protein
MYASQIRHGTAADFSRFDSAASKNTVRRPEVDGHGVPVRVAPRDVEGLDAADGAEEVPSSLGVELVCKAEQEVGVKKVI